MTVLPEAVISDGRRIVQAVKLNPNFHESLNFDGFECCFPIRSSTLLCRKKLFLLGGGTLLAVPDVVDQGYPARFIKQILFSQGEECAIADSSVNSAQQPRPESANRDNQEISYLNGLSIWRRITGLSGRRTVFRAPHSYTESRLHRRSSSHSCVLRPASQFGSVDLCVVDRFSNQTSLCGRE